MEYQLFDGDNLVTSIDAETEREAWKKLNKAGIRNRTNIYTLVENGEY